MVEEVGWRPPVGHGGRYLDLAPATLLGPSGPTGAGMPLGDPILEHF